MPLLNEMETRLRGEYGAEFDGLLNEAMSKFGVKRAALNSLRYRETDSEIIGPFVSTNVRRATRGERKGEIFQVSFRVIDAQGNPALVIAGSDAVKWVQEKFPDVDRLTPVHIGPLTLRTDLLSGGRTFFVKPGKTALKAIEDNGGLNLTFRVSTVQAAVSAQENKTGERDPFSVVYGEVTGVRSIQDKETGDIISVKATVTDMDGSQINVKIEENLEDLFGEQEWLAEPEAIRNALLGMPVLMGGRIFIGKAGDIINDRPLEEDVTSFVVKNGGWIVDMETVSPSVYQAVLESLRTSRATNE